MKSSFNIHLAEARRRILSVLTFYILVVVLSYPLAQPLLTRMKSDLLPETQLVILEPQEAVVAYVNISMLIALTLTFPLIVYHFWAFTAPGLLQEEKKMIAYITVLSALLFTAGVLFSYFILLPPTLKLLIRSAEPIAQPMLSLGSVFSFTTLLLAASGIVFQIPLITAAASRLGLFDYSMLSSHRRHAIVLIVLAAGIITPDPSIVPQLMLSIPMLLLYEVGVFTSKMAGGK